MWLRCKQQSPLTIFTSYEYFLSAAYTHSLSLSLSFSHFRSLFVCYPRSLLYHTLTLLYMFVCPSVSLFPSIPSPSLPLPSPLSLPLCLSFIIQHIFCTSPKLTFDYHWLWYPLVKHYLTDLEGQIVSSSEMY